MTKTLDALLNELEPTDELILLNKHYQRLDTIYDKLSELEELVNNLDSPNITCANNEIKTIAKKGKPLDRDKAAQMIAQLLHQVSFEATHTAYKSREIFTFQKLGKAVSVYKSI